MTTIAEIFRLLHEGLNHTTIARACHISVNEQAAEDFLRKNYKKALVDIGYVDPIEVAKSMGLNVIIRSIT